MPENQEVRLNTKKEIAEIWINDNYKNSEPTCPDCRDTLMQDFMDNDGNIQEGLCCHNYKCLNNNLYKETNKDGVFEIIGKSNK